MSDKTAARLFVPVPLGPGANVMLGREQSHYLVSVMRRPAGSPVILFNGTDGEWQGSLSHADRKAAELSVETQLRRQTAEPDVWLLFAPLKKDRTDFVIEKATELGASLIQPVMTAHTQTARVNTERLQATATEAAEQSRRLTVPHVADAVSLAARLADWPGARTLVYMDETGGGAPLARVLDNVDGAVAFLIGPEGGFAADELDALGKLPFSVAADLGPRTLRAETAVTAALAVRQAVDDMRHVPNAL